MTRLLLLFFLSFAIVEIAAQTDPTDIDYPLGASARITWFPNPSTEIDYNCSGGGFNGATFGIPLGASRTLKFRIYAVSDEIEPLFLEVEDLYMLNGEQYGISFPDGPRQFIRSGRYLEFDITFEPDCTGYFGDHLVLNTSDGACSMQFHNRTVHQVNPQLSIMISAQPDLEEWVHTPETNVMPSNFQYTLVAATNGESRFILDIINNGETDLVINELTFEGGSIDPRNDHWGDALVYGEPIPPGGQRLFWGYYTGNANCAVETVTAKVVSNALSKCGAYSTSTFTFKIVSALDCEISEAPGPSSEGFNRPGGLTTANGKLFPTVTTSNLTLSFATDQEVKYRIFSVNGRGLQTGHLAAGTERHDLQVDALPKGTYWLKILNADGQVFRFVKR